MGSSEIITCYSWFAYNTGRESRVTEQDLTVRNVLHQSPFSSGQLSRLT
jgi:hypothetical protein